MTGKVIGHFLSLGTYLESYSISLIGFSLGSQVIKSCLNTIANLDIVHKSPIQNVYFLGGATYIKEEKTLKQKHAFSKTVHGKITNVFTENDTTLLSF